jgi:hypothetical protein
MDFIIYSEDPMLEKRMELFAECFPETKDLSSGSIRHYLWKHHSKGVDSKSCEYAVLDDNRELIGYYAAIPFVYMVVGQEQTAGMVCDVMTGVKSRGKGVFTKLGTFATNQMRDPENYIFTTGFPRRPEVIPGHIKVGWEVQFNLPMYAKVSMVDAYFKTKKLSAFTPIVNYFISALSKGKSLFSHKNKDINVKVYSSNDIQSIIGIEEYYARLAIETPIYLKKTIDFLKWRLSAPETEYQIALLSKSGVIIGHSITRLTSKLGVPCLGILDLGFINNYRKHSTALFATINKIAAQENAEMIIIMMGKYSYRKYKMWLQGYIRTPIKFSFILKKLNMAESEVDFRNSKNWNLNWIDSDDL